jgi:hypothetical protein
LRQHIENKKTEEVVTPWLERGTAAFLTSISNTSRMPSKKRMQSAQDELFGAPLSCPDVKNLPLIVEPRGSIEVLAPGSIYQPLLLSPRREGIDVGPAELNESEEAFVRDLICRLYPSGNHPKSEKTPLKWDNKEIWLKRNIETRNESFRLRVDDSDWYYPDFIVWILDYETRTQTFGFVDPKGLALGAAGGWSDYKIVSTVYMPYRVERQLGSSGQQVKFEGKEWKFRVRGVLVSTSTFSSLSAQAKFNLNDGNGNLVAATEADFKRARIIFQKADNSYIDDFLLLLTQDSIVDHLLKATARLFDGDRNFMPADELEYDLLLRYNENEQTESEFVGSLIRDYIRPDQDDKHGGWASKKRRWQLIDYAGEGKWGFGSEKATDIRDHPSPCEELWKRRSLIMKK